MPAAHARLGPSSAHRWLHCPASVATNEAEEEQRTSEYAAEGTVAHRVRETCLEIGMEPSDFLGDEMSADGFTFTIGEEMVEALEPGIEWVRSRRGRLVNEYQVKFDRWMPEQFGTLDVGIISENEIVINDLKYGAGVPVHPERNEQLMTYALGFWDNVARHETNATDFLLVIDQPRAAGGGGEWWTTLDELLAFGEKLRDGFNLIFPEENRIGPCSAWEVNPEVHFKAGPKICQWCKGKSDGSCAELARFNMAMMDLVLDDLDGDELALPDANAFGPERRAMVAQHAEFIKKWVDNVHGRVLGDALAGLPSPGLKAAKGKRGAKQWIDESKALLWMAPRLPKGIEEDELFSEPKLLTPTQAEKLIPKAMHEDMASLWVQPEGKPVLVPKDSKKPAIDHSSILDDLDD